MKHIRFIPTVLILSSAINFSMAQTLTTSDYQRAASMLDANLQPDIDHNIKPTWTVDNKIKFIDKAGEVVDYKIFDPKTKITFSSKSEDEFNEKVGSDKTELGYNKYEILSPDGKKVAFIKDWNLWLRELETGIETQLTSDGIENFGYATDNAGWTHSDKAILSWSPDSKKIATFQQDQRHVSDMYLVKTKVGAPELQKWKYPLPEDKEIVKIHRVIIHLGDKPKVVRLKMNPDDHRSTQCDDISCEGGFDDNSWAADSEGLVFVSTSRDHKEAHVRMANIYSGNVIDIFEEIVPTQFESGRGKVNWSYLSESNEIIWYSQRSDWGHLYLYDAKNGKLKKQITSGDFVVLQVLNVDVKNRKIYFLAGGKEKNVNPYFDYFYSVDFDGKNFKLLSPATGNHRISLSPSKEFFIDTYSQPDVPPTTEVRDINGNLISTLAKTDISKLKAKGWQAVKPFSVKSADNRWDLYGLMSQPSKIDPSKKYPVIVYIYPGPQGGSVGSWNFRAGVRDNQALAELGFIVVALEGSCNPGRSKSFHDACYGNMGENTLPDQIAGLKQLKERYPYMDLDRVGIWGHSGGGFATAAAMFKFPDFFKVGISESGNHDNRNYEDDWGERYIGLEQMHESGSSNYAEQANQNLAPNLKGKLLLIHGGMDDNVPPYNSYLVADALIKANKDFDFILLPNARHSYGKDSYYIMRRRWDYFVENLLGAKAPKEFKIEINQD